MPIPTPFHPRTSALNTAMRWKDWAGYYAVCSFDHSHDREYFAFRHAAGVIDVTPLFKYDLEGPDAGAFLARVMSKDVRKLKVGQVTYLCWCDDEGMLVDDGTVSRLDDDRWRVTAAEPSWAWFQRYARGYRMTIEETTNKIGALSIQGPESRAVLAACSDADMDGLRFFRTTRTKLDGSDVWISRTGYTGDLGFEVWCDADDALRVWDAILDAGKPYGVLPCGLDAMDVTRVEAGFIMNGVDYYSAHHCMIESRKSSPYEVGLGWTVKLDREPFNGQAALRAEKAAGPKRKLAGLALDWDAFEALYEAHDLPPEVCSAAWRTAVPIYRNGRQIGKATSGAWSPILKKDLALADLEAEHAAVGTVVDFEVTVEYERKTVPAVVMKRPFFDPERKRA